MTSKLPFDKIHACGNDFVLLNQDPDAETLAVMCDRHHGIGADGAMIFKGENPVRLDHYDPDYSRSFCLNGARSALACLFSRKQIPAEGLMHTEGMELRYEIVDHVRVFLPKRPVNPQPLMIGDIEIEGFRTEVGNPQYVIRAMDLVKFRRLAPRIRHHSAFEQGANVNLVQAREDGWSIYSYERGVEGFTKACGSGIYAAALVLAEQDNINSARFFPEGRGSVLVTAHDEELAFEGPTGHVASGVWLC